MFDNKLRKIIGSRIKARRKELNLTQDYLAKKLDVNKSTIQRYESGTIDNTKKLVIEGLAAALHVTPEYLRGETDSCDTEIKGKINIQIRDVMDEILETLPLGISRADNEFAEDMLLLLLAEYCKFAQSFTIACNRYKEHDDLNEKLSAAIGSESENEFNRMFFTREIMHTSNLFYELSEVLRNYAAEPDVAYNRIKVLLDDYDL